MKRALVISGATLAVLVAVGALFREPLKQMAIDQLTADMFVAADSDSYDPGLAIGERFPALRALHQGNVVSDMGQFIHDRGMVFIANRSVDW